MTAVLQAILAAGVSTERPFDPVFAKKATLARMAQCSEASVYRALKLLEEMGWITRTQQERLEDGSLDIGLIAITEKLAVIVGLISNITKQHETVESNNSVIVTRTIGQQNSDCAQRSNSSAVAAEQQQESPPCAGIPPEQGGRCKNNPIPEMTDGLQDGPIYTGERRVDPKASVNNQSATQPAFVRIEGRSVARELVWLIEEKRLSFGGLFQLQVLAKKVPGQRLSDFVAYRRDRISQLPTTNDCYRYLRALIRQGIDACFLNRVCAEAKHQALRNEQRRQVASKRQAWCQARNGVTVVDPRTNESYTIKAEGGLLERRSASGELPQANLRINSQFIKAVEEGRLVPKARVSAPLDREFGNRRLDELTARFPWLRRKGSANANR